MEVPVRSAVASICRCKFARIVVTERAVEKHVTSIFQKLRLPAAGDTHRRVLAVLTYLRS